jgi:maltose alpha-D-glucosyltransferase/alpha-amylase
LSQRWYAAKSEKAGRARLADHALWQTGGGSWLLALFDVEGAPPPATYFVPLVLAWEDGEEERVRGLAAVTLAKVRQQAKTGVLGDAFGDEGFCRAIASAIGSGLEIATAGGKLRFTPTRAYPALADFDLAGAPVNRPQALSSNTTVALGDRLLLKGYRGVRPGLAPELEIGRFLTEIVQFPNCVPLAGSVEHVAADGTVTTLALLQAYIKNQGDGWQYTLNYLGRFLETSPEARPAAGAEIHGAYISLVAVLGKRTAELHHALSTVTGDAAFDPEPVTPQDYQAWKTRALDEARATLQLLEQRVAGFAGPLADAVQALLKRRAALLYVIESCPMPRGATAKIRHHGDYHLGQVLVHENDFVIIDFEGEPGRSHVERRAKHSPLRDVAGMLRSFDYARWTALKGAAKSPQDHARLQPLAAEWQTQARHAFLAAYATAAAPAGGDAGLADAGGLLRLFELEKALYELRYEINNRPDWAHIPLQGIDALMESAGSQPRPAGT